MSRRQSRQRRHVAAAAAASARPDAAPVQASASFGIQGPAQVIGMATGSTFWDPAYQAAGIDRQDTVNWWPSRSSGDALTLPAKDITLARVRDILRNDPNAKAAVDRLVDLVVGPGLHLAANPDGTALGIADRKELRTFARAMQAEWRLFSKDPRRTCDAQRKLSMNGLFRLFARTWIVAGEALAVLSWRDAPAGQRQRYSTCVMAIDPDRMSNPNNMQESPTLRGGVEMDAFGAPIAYHIRNAHVGDWWDAEAAWTWTRVPRATEWGRPIVVHGFEPDREGQTRAISPFVSLITRLKMIFKHGESELASAAANALFAAFVTSDLPVDDVAERMSPQAATYADKFVDHYTKHPAHVGGVRIPVMMPGSEIKMNNAPRQTASFASFQTAFLQSIASALGLTYEQLSMDWSRVNYSSARAALNEVWRSVKRMCSVFVEQIVEPIYYAVMEEAFDRGYLKLPASAKPLGMEGIAANDNLSVFQSMPGALLRARWIGPGRGWIDPLKEAQSSALRMGSRISNLQMECADQGHDYEDIIDQIEVEEEYLAERGLTRLSLVAAVQTSKAVVPDSEEAQGPAGPGGEEQQNKQQAA